MNHESLNTVDHLVYAVPDLEQGIGAVEALTGVRAAFGGAHPNWGTANALLSLGPSTYLEIIGPDPQQAAFSGTRIFRIDTVSKPTLVNWAARRGNLDTLSGQRLPHGEHLGKAFPANRRTPEGALLEWVLTDPSTLVADGLVPFFIDWGTSPHPAQSAPSAGALVDLYAEHPDPAQLALSFEFLELDLEIVPAPRPALVAVLETPAGRIEIR